MLCLTDRFDLIGLKRDIAGARQTSSNSRSVRLSMVPPSWSLSIISWTAASASLLQVLGIVIHLELSFLAHFTVDLRLRQRENDLCGLLADGRQAA
jgi:hypothetical protein